MSVDVCYLIQFNSPKDEMLKQNKTTTNQKRNLKVLVHRK